MARVTHVVTIDEVARQIGENLELVELVSANSDNIDYGEKIWVDNGTEEGITTFTDRGVECLQELLADIRTWNGGILGFLRAEKCEPDVIERIMADEKSREVQTALGVSLRWTCHWSFIQPRPEIRRVDHDRLVLGAIGGQAHHDPGEDAVVAPARPTSATHCD